MFDKLFNSVSVAWGIVGGFFCAFLGGYDRIIKALVILVILDYITGLLKAVMTKTLSSATGFKGIFKKVVIFIVVGAAVVIQSVVSDAVPLREIAIMFYICNEGISLLENAAEFIPLPAKLKSTLIQLRESEGDSDEN